MLTTMDYQKTMRALKRLRVETGSLACFGCGHEHNCSTLGCAILRNAVAHMEAALERATLTPPNEPLTPDQLRGMYGEPVWVTSARERGNIPSRWVLFAGVSKSKRNSDVFVFATTGGIAQGYEAVNYGKTWNAYRRPPEGEEDNNGT